MIFSPWAMGLTTGSVIIVWLLFRAAWPSLVLIFKRGDQNSQFHLYTEKQEILSNALIRLAFVYVFFSPILLTCAAFEFAGQIPGAMCPTGVFNANGFGFPLLLVRLFGLFPFITWMVLYTADQQTPDMPFTAFRRLLIIGLFSWALTDTFLQAAFFLNLNTQVTTACCAVLFDASKSDVQISMTLFSRFPSKSFFFIAALLYVFMGGFGLAFGKKPFLLLYGLLSPAVFFLFLAGMTSCISPYVYALPHHHCPFCILSGKEAVIGIPLTVLAFIGPLSAWKAWNHRIALHVADIHEKNNTWFIVSVVANSLFTGGSAAVLIVYHLFGEFL